MGDIIAQNDPPKKLQGTVGLKNKKKKSSKGKGNWGGGQAQDAQDLPKPKKPTKTCGRGHGERGDFKKKKPKEVCLRPWD